MTREEFISKARNVHGDKYDYSNVVFADKNTHVEIKCNKCGRTFKQKPSRHLMGFGCRFHNGAKKVKTTEKFIQEAVAIHGDKYDYSKTVYTGVFNKLTVICPKHGEFLIDPHHHLRGHGCRKCSDEACSKRQSKTQEEFIKEVTEKFGDKYDYSLAEYKGNMEKVKIICKKCGNIFEQAPSNHLQGQDCPICAKEKLGATTRHTKEEFEKMAREVHKNKYSYEKVQYINNKTPLTIICPEHGEFQQTPSSHLRGAGCPHCSNCAKVTVEEFIRRSTIRHIGKGYDYSMVSKYYKNIATKVPIICPKHGVFWQAPSHHMLGCGCPSCCSSHLEDDMARFLEGKWEYIRQHKFDWLKAKRKLRLDFYLPKYNIAIECQGQQHFMPSHFGAKYEPQKAQENLIKIQEYDAIKKRLCEEHGVRLLYFNYNDKIKDFKEILVRTIGETEAISA